MRGSVVCFIAPATFLTSLGLMEAAIIRTNAVLSSTAGVATSTNSSTKGSPKVSNRSARITCFSLGGIFPDEEDKGRNQDATRYKNLNVPTRPGRAIKFVF